MVCDDVTQSGSLRRRAGRCWAWQSFLVRLRDALPREAFVVVVVAAGEEPAGVAGAVRLGLGPQPRVSGTGAWVTGAVVAAIAGCRS